MKNYIILLVFCILRVSSIAQVSNPGFESGNLVQSGNNYLLDSWEFVFNGNGGEAVPSLDSVIKHSGSRSFRADVTNTGTPAHSWNIKLDMTSDALHSFNKDDDVEFSLYARANTKGSRSPLNSGILKMETGYRNPLC